MSEDTLPQQIADRLRRDILRGKLAPGDPIKERDNAAELGVSRTPLREAIRILAKEELVVLRPSRSPLVADPTLEEVSDAVDVLRVLETFSGGVACRNATADEIAGIAALHEKIADLYDAIDPLDLFEIDMEFHLAIVRAAHNAALAQTHRSYLARLWRVRYLSAIQRRSRETVLCQHGAMVEGLKSRDAGRIRAEIEGHFEHMLENVRHHFRTREAARAEAEAAQGA